MPNLKEIGREMSELRLETRIKIVKNGRQAAILDRITTKIDMHMYDTDACSCTHFERNLLRHDLVVA